MLLFPAATDRCDCGTDSNTKRWEMSANGIGDIARRKMRVVLFRHSRVGVSELRGNDAHRYAAHGKRRRSPAKAALPALPKMDLQRAAACQPIASRSAGLESDRSGYFLER